MCHAQFYGTNEDTSHVFFGDASSKKFGTYFVKDGKVRDITEARCALEMPVRSTPYAE